MLIIVIFMIIDVFYCYLLMINIIGLIFIVFVNISILFYSIDFLMLTRISMWCMYTYYDINHKNSSPTSII
jgi:hypothetical protein